ncbi:helix-turn-helix domain-containing protein [Pseudoalteromonas sp. DL2-H2.2]|uniref:AraC family transcriptional regulator n=1 Tax=Pseudoalteromonas sp. DL2-H2.2 TaxID=2908889 RepID=UPI001F26DB1D|nr:helix-turn-helix domain-containing protein [Pseudoalteromonas sp. DL2-H2.2]MCF2909356.1 helix-turn-helix domain-containing protein [Pseudoalteromonas sp. DL2-H2.2]
MNKKFVPKEYKTQSAFDATTQLRAHFGFHHLNTEKSAFNYLDRVYSFGDFRLIEISITGSTEVKHYTNPDNYEFDFPVNGYFLIESKVLTTKVTNQGVFITSPGTKPHFTLPEGISALVLQIRKDHLMSALNNMVGYKTKKELCFPNSIGDQAAVECVKTALHGIIQSLKTIKNSDLQAQYVKHADQYLKTLLLTVLDNSAQALINTSNHPPLPKVLKCADTYMHENINKKITMADLTQVTQVSSRSLTYSFKKHTQKTPMSYLLDLRLMRLRKALLTAKSDAKILALSMSVGLTHLGRMSLAYKNRFGELPSETLKQLKK